MHYNNGGSISRCAYTCRISRLLYQWIDNSRTIREFGTHVSIFHLIIYYWSSITFKIEGRTKATYMIKTLYPVLHKNSKNTVNHTLLLYKQIIRHISTYVCPIFCSMAKSYYKKHSVKEDIFNILKDKSAKRKHDWQFLNVVKKSGQRGFHQKTQPTTESTSQLDGETLWLEVSLNLRPNED